MARPREYDAELRLKLVAGAAAAVAAGGTDSLSLRALARGADTSTNAVYTLFGSRDGLLGAVLQAASDSFTAAQRSVPLTADPAADFGRLGRVYRTWALENRSLYAVMFGANSGELWRAGSSRGGDVGAPETDPTDCLPTECPPTGDSEEMAMGPLLDHIRHGQALGVLRAAEPAVVATVIWAGVHGFVSLEIAQWGDHPRAELDARYEECLNAAHSYWESH